MLLSTLTFIQLLFRPNLVICRLWRKATNTTVENFTTERLLYLLLLKVAQLGADLNRVLVDRTPVSTAATAMADATVSMAGGIHHLPETVQGPARDYQPGHGVPMVSHRARPLLSIITATESHFQTLLIETGSDHLEIAAQLWQGMTSIHTSQATNGNVWIAMSKTVDVETDQTLTLDEHAVARRLQEEYLTESGNITEIADRIAIDPPF